MIATMKHLVLQIDLVFQLAVSWVEWVLNSFFHEALSGETSCKGSQPDKVFSFCLYFFSLSFQCWNSPFPHYFKGKWLMVLIMIYNFVISTCAHHHDSWCIIITSPVSDREVRDEMPAMLQAACWCRYWTSVCVSDGRHSSGLFCFSCQQSWDGWKWAVSPGTFRHVYYFLTGSLSTSLHFGQIYLGRFHLCVADLQRFPASLAPSCLWATSMLVPGPCHVWCVTCSYPPLHAVSSPNTNSWRRCYFRVFSPCLCRRSRSSSRSRIHPTSSVTQSWRSPIARWALQRSLQNRPHFSGVKSSVLSSTEDAVAEMDQVRGPPARPEQQEPRQ